MASETVQEKIESNKKVNFNDFSTKYRLSGTKRKPLSQTNKTNCFMCTNTSTYGRFIALLSDDTIVKLLTFHSIKCLWLYLNIWWESIHNTHTYTYSMFTFHMQSNKSYTYQTPNCTIFSFLILLNSSFTRKFVLIYDPFHVAFSHNKFDVCVYC